MRELIEALDALAKEKWSKTLFDKRRKILLALFGGATRDGMYRALLEELPLGGGTIRAVLLDEGDPLSEPFPDNPWGIRRDETLVGAIDHVWNLFDAPALTAALLERVFALALIEQAGALELGYVIMHERDIYEVPDEFRRTRKPPFDRRNALAWEPFGDLAMFTGKPPSLATRTPEGHPIPEALRDLYRIHGGLGDGMWTLSDPELVPWSKMLDKTGPVRCADPDEVIRAEELLYLFSYGDDRSDLLDIRDPDEVVIRAWGDGHLYEGGGQLFQEWLESQTSLIVKIAGE